MRNGTRPAVDRRQGVACLLSGAILVAPFLALLYDLDAGLAVMALTLAASVELARQAIPQAAPEIRPRIQTVMVVNALLAMVCGTTLAVRLM
jgi:hypothetical protein